MDCQGSVGPVGPAGEPGSDGADGSDGVTGAQGAQGPAGEDGEPGPQGPTGPGGPSGPSGSPGADGAALFDMFIDDFFTVGDGDYGTLELDPGDDLPIEEIREPALGVVRTMAFRMAIPQAYTPFNPVTMRLFFWREGPFDGCTVLRLDAFRLRHAAGVIAYGEPRFIRIDGPKDPDPTGILVTMDLPLNNGKANPAEGLSLPDDLLVADFLAFEFNTLDDYDDGGTYTLLGANFFESSSDDDLAVVHATIFDSRDEIDCTAGPIVDCNENGIDDGDETAPGVCTEKSPAWPECVDCNANNIPDVCEISSDSDAPGGPFFCQPDCIGCPDECDPDCNDNGIPDACDDQSPQCPTVDLVFIVDTSVSMQDQSDVICAVMDEVVTGLEEGGVKVNPLTLAISPNFPKAFFPCLSPALSVGGMMGNDVPGEDRCPGGLDGGGDQESDENWGPATAITAGLYRWSKGAIRVVVPISDEGPCLGSPCDIDGGDGSAIDNAIAIALAHDVIVAPITALGADDCTITLADQIANETGGIRSGLDDAAELLPALIGSIVLDSCVPFCDEGG
ncbi:MAG: collagen-like protein [Planctomycetes bacterium]|nr:collagen-like protein [Planctomycetota bacterium]